MRIGVCDEDEMWRVKINSLLENYRQQQLLEMTVVSLKRSDYLVFNQKNEVHVLFIDIESGNSQGIEAAHEIIKKWTGCQIVFLIKEMPCILNLYRVPHLCVVLKDQLERRMEDIMDMAMQKLRALQQRIVFKIHGKAHLIMAAEEIVLLERDRRITHIVSTRGEFISNEKLSLLVERLPVIDFVRCHNSYIVNFPAVTMYEKNMFLMNNGREIIISRTYEQKVKKAYERWQRLNFDCFPVNYYIK